ncbi:MAG: hypothetical protein ABFS37_07630 [Acidobacteriota bacterium]
MKNTRLTPPSRSLRMEIPVLFAILLVVAGLGMGCSPAPSPPAGVSNTELDLSIGDLGDAWVVKTNRGTSLVVTPSDPERQGTIEILVGPEETGINLIEAIEIHRKDIESRPDGVYSGAQELTGPMGTAFYSRGRFGNGDSTMEETRILAMHPRSSRIIKMVYLYPAGDDSSTRVGELIELFAEVG